MAEIKVRKTGKGLTRGGGQLGLAEGIMIEQSVEGREDIHLFRKGVPGRIINTCKILSWEDRVGRWPMKPEQSEGE